jgi:Uma2 family endonuclease
MSEPMATAKAKSILHADGDALAANGSASTRSLRLTPAWAGRDISLEEFENADTKEGWRYELIDGRVEVHPLPNPPHDIVLEWMRRRLLVYSDSHAPVINYVTSGCRVFIPGRRQATCPQPDISAFQGFPLRWPRSILSWQEVNPILVVEVISPRYAHKDLVRNVALYREAPSVREYWIFDPRDRSGRVTMSVYRKRGSRSWQKPIDVPFAGTYTTPLLPEFTLVVDPSA